MLENHQNRDAENRLGISDLDSENKLWGVLGSPGDSWPPFLGHRVLAEPNFVTRKIIWEAVIARALDFWRAHVAIRPGRCFLCKFVAFSLGLVAVGAWENGAAAFVLHQLMAFFG
jgi:hypothetical protein